MEAEIADTALKTTKSKTKGVRIARIKLISLIAP